MTDVVRVLSDNPLLLLFVVCAIGVPLGRLRLGGASLGTASVLFVGIAFGAVDPRLRLPDVIYLLGLAIFVYAIGLSSGTLFFGSWNRRGLRDILLALGTLSLAGAAAAWLGNRLGIPAAQASAMYSGAFTNASGVATVIETLKSAKASEAAVAAPVIAYSLAYPIGILGPMLTMLAAKAMFRVDLAKEALTIDSYRRSLQPIEVRTIRVTRPEVIGRTIGDLGRAEAQNLVFGRVRHLGQDLLARPDIVLAEDDLVTVVGPSDELEGFVACVGEASDAAVEQDRSAYDVRRIFVSDPKVAGHPLREVALPQRLGALITRVRRGDLDFIPSGDTILQLGDRVRVLARREDLPAISRFFGDSYRKLSEIDFATLSLGLAAGLLLGLVQVPLPGGIRFQLGFAGGPLVVAVILGRLERTGPLLWNLPYSGNLMLRQFGLMLFAAGIGTKAGYGFFNTLSHGEGLTVFLGGMALTFGGGLFLLTVGHKLLKIPLNHLLGVYAGAQTQPVSLSFAVDQTKNDIPNTGYATLFPLATVFKILVAQILLTMSR